MVEPWPALVNVAEQFNGHSSLPHSMAVCAGVGAAWGLVCAGVSAVILVAFALLTGRDLCNDVCPVGSILTLAGSKAAMHIEFYPDRCTACLKCEDVCKAGCIDIKNRTIDDARCLRCFNCIAECPDDALKYQLNPNGIITPLFRPGGAQTSASNRN